MVGNGLSTTTRLNTEPPHPPPAHPCHSLRGAQSVQNYNAFARMTDFCETRVPSEVREALQPITSDDDAVKAYGVDLGIRMCKALMEAGAPGE